MSDYIPKVGDNVEYKCPQLNDSYENGLVVAIDDGLYVIKCSESDENSPAYNGYPLSCIRPIKSARDKAIDEICESVSFPRAICASFYDAGCRKVKPISLAEYEDTCNGASTYQDDYKKLVELGHIVSE